MPGDVPHRLHGKRFAIYFHLIAFHSLLDGSADIANTNINSGILRDVSCVWNHVILKLHSHLDTSVRCILDCSQ
jgi:hypothetical protein